MAKKKWIAGAIKHPGAEKKAAAAAGISTQETFAGCQEQQRQLAGKRASLGNTLSRLAQRKK